MDLTTTIANALRGSGFGRTSYSGMQLQVINDGNCVECFAWDISTYRAALYLFIGTCVEITLYWGRFCRSDAIGLNVEGMPNTMPVTWTQVAFRKVEIDDCEFDEASEVDHDDLRSKFMMKLGKTLPNT